MSRRTEWLWLAAITALAAALRFSGLGVESLWLDEGYAVRMAREPLERVVGLAARETHPPLYALLLHLWIAAWGHSETAVRSLSALAGTLTVPVLYALGRRLLGPWSALLAALLLALSGFHLHYSQEARSYALLALLAGCSWLATLRLAERWRARDVGLAALVATALVYTHHVGWFVLAAQAVGWWMLPLARGEDARRAWRRGLLVPALALAAFLPWIGALRGQVALTQAWTWVARPTARSLGSTLVEIAGSPPLAALALVLALWALWRARSSAPRRAEWMLAAWALIPVLAPFAIARIGPPIYVTRAAIAATLPLLLLVARGACALRPGALAAVAATLWVALTLPTLAAHFEAPHRERWREAVRDLEREARAGDLVVLDAGYALPNAWAYYARRRDLETRPLPGDPAGADFAAATRDLDARARVWVVRSHDGAAGETLVASLAPTHHRVLERRYESRTWESWRRRHYLGVRVERFERVP